MSYRSYRVQDYEKYLKEAVEMGKKVKTLVDEEMEYSDIDKMTEFFTGDFEI